MTATKWCIGELRELTRRGLGPINVFFLLYPSACSEKVLFPLMPQYTHFREAPTWNMPPQKDQSIPENECARLIWTIFFDFLPES
jgi:hypothetical protein